MGNGLCSEAGVVSRENSFPGTPPARVTQDRTPSPAAAAPTPASVRNGSSQQSETPPRPATPEAPSPATPPQQAASTAATSARGGGRVPLMAPTLADRKAAEDLKSEGNALFARAKYAAAIEKYTEAITLCPEWAVLYVNRGMAARKRGEWERVEEDAGTALGLGPGEREAMKGHYLMGLAAGARGQHERSTHHLRKALDAAREANDSIKDEIWRELAAANYSQWLNESAARRQRHAALRRQLADMLAAAGGKVGPANGSVGGRNGHGNGSAGPALPAEWEALFQAAAWQDVAKEAPSQFTCPLTMEIFRDPVVTPSGRSYERASLLEHLKKVGRFDPITRQPLSEEQLVPNVSLRAAIEQYLEEHPWGWGEVK